MKIKGMTPVRSGIVFTLIMLIFLGVSFLVSLVAWRGGSVTLSIFQNILLSESIVLLPGLIVATVCGSEVGEIFRFRKLKVSTWIYVVIFMICIEPLVSAVNALSLLFSENAAADIAKEYINEDSSFFFVAMVMAVIGPLAEELAFRGIIYAGLRKSGRLLSAIVLQALLFGLMHLNLNQMSYAIVLGIAFGIMDEVTNSLWPGIIGHFMINFGGVAGAFLVDKYMPDAYDSVYSKTDILYTFAFYAILSVLFTTLAVFMLKLIAKNEPGGQFRLHRIFHSKDLKIVTSDGNTAIVKRPPVWTVPVVIGIVIAVVEMGVTAVLQM
ncbi:MAG: CPBP family intramembrane metalloprotease [Lachnospiraceae bacterium]|nr:CPBP family intramembrane metalloprotease [Lachnospiraceae bacterium]